MWGRWNRHKQPNRGKENPFQTVEAGSGERKSSADYTMLMWGGRGGGANVGEARGCVLTTLPLLPQSLCVFRAENRKVVVKSVSDPAAPPGTPINSFHSDRFPLFSLSLLTGLSLSLSFILT